MGLFRRAPLGHARFRITAVTPVDTTGRLVLNGMPQQRVHVSGLIERDGSPPQAAAYDVRIGIDRTLTVGQVLAADIRRESPLKVTVQWDPPRAQRQVDEIRGDAITQVIADLAATGATTHVAGETDATGIALSAPGAPADIAQQLAASLGTPVSIDIDEDGVKRHVTAGGGGHLSSAEAAALLQTGTPATATIASARRVPVLQAMLPGPDASLWDLDLDVQRGDGTVYRASTRVGFRSAARRGVLGEVGLRIPVRIDPADDTRVAVDGARFDADHPDAPKG